MMSSPWSGASSTNKYKALSVRTQSEFQFSHRTRVRHSSDEVNYQNNVASPITERLGMRLQNNAVVSILLPAVYALTNRQPDY